MAAEPADPDDDDDVDNGEAGAEAMAASIEAPLTMFDAALLAADKALAKFGRDPTDELGAKTAANGEEAAETKPEADEPEAVLTGLV